MARAPSKYMQAVKDELKGRPRSTAWYREKIKELGTPTTLDLIRDGKRNTRPFYGKLNMFMYDPKFKKTLPYYDTFPLVLPLEKYDDGFLGINLHYLPIPLRIRLLDRLVDFSNDTASAILNSSSLSALLFNIFVCSKKKWAEAHFVISTI